MKPNCYACVHRRTIPGDAHSRCEHPSVVALGMDRNEFAAVGQVMAGKFASAGLQLQITAYPTGINRGWFAWPANFDPTWLMNCAGFEAKAQPVEVK